HVLVDLKLAFQLDHRAGRGVDVQEHIMALAVFLDAIGKSAQAPIFLLLDLAAFAFDDGFEVGRQRVHLLRADVLARDQEMLVKSHVPSFASPAERRKGGHPVWRFGSPARATIALSLSECRTTAAVFKGAHIGERRGRDKPKAPIWQKAGISALNRLSWGPSRRG